MRKHIIKKERGREMYSDTMAKLLLCLVWMVCIMFVADGAISKSVMHDIDSINKEGPYLGIVVPNSFEMNPLLQSPSFVLYQKLRYLDFAAISIGDGNSKCKARGYEYSRMLSDDFFWGSISTYGTTGPRALEKWSGRRFRIGTLEREKVIIVMTGLSMLNAGIATQLLLSLFKIKGVVLIGIAGNANPQLQIGDVTIPRFWAHTGLWNWQRYGEGPENQLALESNGDYTRTIGNLKFSNYNNDSAGNGKFSGNLLNSVWYQPEEIFPKDGYPEVRQHAFWVPVHQRYFSLAKKLEGIKLKGCVNSTCLPRTPRLTRVERGVSANVFVDNGAYREFLHTKFNATPIDMESAAVALICHQQKAPFVAIRALSDLAGGGSAVSNEAGVFAPLAAQNAVDVLIQFITLLHS